MANGGFEIPVDIKPQVQDSGNTQKFFTDLANQGTAAINKVARAAGQPITQEISFEVKDGKLQASIRNTSTLLKKMERAQEAAKKKEEAAIKKNAREQEAAYKRQQQAIQRLAKMEEKRLAELERRSKAARQAEIKEIQKAVAAGQKQLEKEKQISAEARKRAGYRKLGLEPQRMSIAMTEKQLALGRERLNNLAFQSDQYMKQQKVVKGLENQLKKMGDVGKSSSLAIVSGFVKAQIVMAALATVMRTVTDVFGTMIQRGKDMQALEVSFKAFGLTAADAGDSLEFTKNVALTYGAELGALDKTMRRITPTIVTMGGNLNDSKLLTEALAKRTAMLGLNTEQSGRYLEAFAQVMGKGKLQSEELNQQFSELDGALRGQVAQYLAANYGITNLNKAMEQGEVKADMFAAAFLDASQNMSGLNQVDLSNMTAQLASGEAILQQVQNAINTIKIDNLEQIGAQFKNVQLAAMEMWLGINQLFADPTIQQVIGVIADGLAILLQTVDKLGKAFAIAFKAIIDWLTWAGQALYDFLSGIPIIGDAVKGLGDKFKLGAQQIADFGGSIDEAYNEMFKLPEAADTAQGSLSELGQTAAEAVPTFEAWGPVLTQASAGLEDLAKKSVNGKDAMYEYEDAMTAFKDKVADQVKVYQDLKKEIREKINLEEIDAEAGKARIKQIDEQITAMKRKGKEIETNTKRVAKESAEVKQGMEKQAKAATSAAESVKTAAGAWRDWSKSVNDSFAKTEMTLGQLKNLQTAVQKLSTGQRGLSKEFGNTAEQAQLLDGALEGQIDEARRLLQYYARMEAMGYKLSDSQKSLVASLKKTVKAFDEQAAAAGRASNAMKKSTSANKENITTRRIIAQFDVYGQKIKPDEVIDWGMMSISEAQRKFAELNKKENDFKLAKARDKENARRASLQQEAMSKMEEAWGDFLENSTAVTRTFVDGVEQTVELTKQQEQALRTQFENAFRIGNAQTYAQAVFQPRKGQNSYQGFPMRESGGPVSGGSTYTVNERGREGFLSASGRLSEIKVPSWGSWTAPSSGEVIPAHVWSEMKAANSAVTASASRMASSGASGMVSHVRQSGDVDNSRVTNHVTIQSASPIQAASEVMVAAAKRRRRRFR